jgi:hypothetical protein
MISLNTYERSSILSAGLTGSMSNSTFAQRRSVEAATEQRMRRQREARLQQRASALPSLDIPFIRDARLPQRWTEE